MFDSVKNLIKQLVYTDELATKINKKDKKAIRQFFENNYDLIIQIAKNTSSIRYDEYVNQFYVDMPLFNFTTKNNLIKSINKSFIYIDCGGICGKSSELKNIRCDLSLDKTITENSENIMLYYFGYDYDYLEKMNEQVTMLEQEKKEKQIKAFLKDTFKNKETLNKMISKIL